VIESSLNVVEPPRAALARDGFTLLRGLLSADACARYRAIAAELYLAQPEEARAARFAAGSLISFWSSERLAEIVAAGLVARTLEGLGFSDPRFSNGYVIHKPPRSPRMFWHQDWFAWSHPASYQPPVLQVGCLFYLQRTTRRNGAIRVIPGSHLRRHPLHLPVTEARLMALRRGDDLRAPEFAPSEDEVTIEAEAGDAIVLDARLLHATHDNDSSESRTTLLLWYAPEFDRLPAGLRALYGEVRVPASWPPLLKARIFALGTYETPGEPAAIAIEPDERLRA
jgi:phytanoyl-CoA dioxygenase PhyH